MSLSLKIFIVAAAQSKTLRFVPEMSVTEALREIREKAGGVGGEDHGLFLPAPIGKKGGKWLKEKTSLMSYNLTSGMELMYKKKHQLLRAKLIDGTIKTIIIDWSLTVQDVVEELGKKLHLPHSEEYGLQAESCPDEWLHAANALEEQEVVPEDLVLLKKQYFFSDDLVDREDPMGMHLLFAQARTIVLSGELPCIRSEAINLAAIDCQIQFGPYNPEKHKPGVITMKDVVPLPYLKDKTFERDMFKEWRKLIGLNESNSKLRYIQLCRSLKTWGITTFEAKLPPSGLNKKKQVTLLLGVTRENICIMDEETKEITKTYPLTKIKRYSASPGNKTITFDFGDYESQYLVLHTDACEKIASLISGYIEIIVKKKRAAARVVEYETGEVGQIEAMAPARGYTNILPQSSVFNVPSRGNMDSLRGTMRAPNQITDLRAATAVLSGFSEELVSPTALSFSVQSGMTGEQWATQLVSEINLGNDATKAALTTLVNPVLADKAKTMGAANQMLVATESLVLAAKQTAVTTNNDAMVSASKVVVDSLQSVISLTDQMFEDPNPSSVMKEAVKMAQGAYESGVGYLKSLAEGGVTTDHDSQNLVKESGRAVSIAMQKLLDAASAASTRVGDSQKKLNIQNVAIGLQTASKILDITTGDNMASALLLPENRAQLSEASRITQGILTQLAQAAKGAGLGSSEVNKLLELISQVGSSINVLNEASDCVEGQVKDVVEIPALVEELKKAIIQIKQSVGDTNAFVNYTKIITDITNEIISSSRLLANVKDYHTKGRLLDITRKAADSLNALVVASRTITTNPQDFNALDELQVSCNRLELSIIEISSTVTLVNHFTDIRKAAKMSFATLTSLTSSLQQMPFDPATSSIVNKAIKNASESNSKLIASLKVAKNNAVDEQAINNLVEVSQKAILPVMELVSTTRKVVSKIPQQDKRMALRTAADSVSGALQELLQASKNIIIGGGNADIEEAFEQIDASEAELEAAEFASQSGQMTLTGQSRDDLLALMTLSTKTLGRAVDDLKDISQANPSEVGPAAKEVAYAMTEMSSSVKGLISANPDKGAQARLISGAKELNSAIGRLITAAKLLANGDKNGGTELTESIQIVYAAISVLTASSRGFDTRVVDDSVASIMAQSARTNEIPENVNTKLDYETLKEELSSASKATMAAIGQVVNFSKTSPQNLGSAAKIAASTIPSLVDAAVLVAANAPSRTVGEKILNDTRAIITHVATVLNQAKITAASRDQYSEQALGKVSKELTDDLHNLLTSLGESSNKDAEQAIQLIIEYSESVEKAGITPEKLISMEESIQDVATHGKSLGAIITMLLSASRGSPEQLGKAAKEAARVVNSIVKATRILKSEDFTDVRTAPADFRELGRQIVGASRQIVETTDKSQVLAHARILATANISIVQLAKKHTLTFYSPEQQEAMMKSAQRISFATSSLAKAAKGALAQEPGSQEAQIKSSREVIEAVKDVLHASAGEQGSQSKINEEILRKLTLSVRRLGTTTAQLVSSSYDVARKPKDPEAQNLLAAAGKALADAIGELLKTCSVVQPGVAETQEAISSISSSIGDLQTSLISVTIDNFEKIETDLTHGELQDKIINVLRTLGTDVREVVTASRLQKSDDLGKYAKALQEGMNALVQACKGAVSTTVDQESRTSLLNLTKEVADLTLKILQSAKVAVTNPAMEAHKEVQVNSQALATATGSLIANLRSSGALNKQLDEAIESIEVAVEEYQVPITGDAKNYAQFKDEIIDATKVIAGAIRKIFVDSQGNVALLGESAMELANIVPTIVKSAKLASNSTSVEGLARTLIDSSRKLAESLSDIIKGCKVAASDRSDKGRTHLSNSVKSASQNMNQLIQAAKQGAVGENMCEEAIALITKSVGELDAASLFAAAGQLELEGSTGASPEQSKKEMIAAAKNVAASASQLVNASKQAQEQLGAAARSLAAAITSLYQNVKAHTSVINSSGKQQSLLAAAKASSIAAQRLVLAGKDAQISRTEANYRTVHKGAEMIADSISGLISVANTEDDSKGVQALLNSKAELSQITQSFAASEIQPDTTATPSDVVKSARQVAQASAALATANTDQSLLESAAIATAEACKRLVETSFGAASRSDNEKSANAVRSAAKTVISNMNSILDALKEQNTTGVAQQQISASAKAVADSIAELMQSLKALPGGASVKMEDVEIDDIEKLAGDELFAVLNQVEDATDALIAARAAPKPEGIAFGTSDVIDAIMDAAILVAKSTQKLIQAASAAQNERLSNQQENPSMYKKDPMWANGLISAVKSVADATKHLVKSATNTVHGQVKEEELVAVARQVAAATAQLVAASRAKTDNLSKAHSSLGVAAKSVAAATHQLVTAAKQATALQEETEESELASNYTGSAVRKLEAQMKIAKLEKDLELARKNMFAMRKNEYKK